jgi:hypothetical protein
MEKAIIYTLAAALVGLFFSRLHFHFSFNLTISRSLKFNAPTRAGDREAKRQAGNLGGGTPSAVRSIRQCDDVSRRLEAARASAEADLSSALVNLGVTKQKAGEVAKRAIVQGGKDFDSRFRWAIQNAA